ncbi:hypothetical protein CHU98_g7234 [Xylaria longipes]|nr:hypothetical protein CHU98_g7234 [Xylaria longipes]
MGAARDAILMVLLYSHVRSFRNRAALGQRDWKGLFGRLESKSLADEIGQIPNLIGVYALHAPCKAEFRPHSLGIQLRARGHLNEIDRHKRLQHSQVKERRSWMYTKLSHEDTEEVSHRVLSTLPFPRDYTQEASLHLPFLLTLMEAIDMIYLETLNPQSVQTAQAWGANFVSDLRPKEMPCSPFYGLNQALPIKQNHRRFGISLTANLTLAECLTFIKTVNDNADRVYPAGRDIDWAFLISRLSEQGIQRDERTIKRLHRTLSAQCDSGMMTKRTRCWQQTPPDLVKLTSRDSVYVSSRINEVVRYHIWKSDLKGHGDWSEMLRIWNASRARLLADGVPPHRALPTCRPILGIWYRSSQYLLSDTVPAWKYDATMDGGPAREDSKFMEPVAPQPSSFVLSDDEAMEDAECGREEEWDESLFQSDADRLGGLMASRPGLSAAAARSASATRKTLMRINVRADAPLIIGQYKMSTLAVLARRMQDVHRSVFGDSDGPETPEGKDKKYWENLRLEDYGNIWDFNQRKTAKSRFEWVLTYIRTGELPADAKLGQCLLRETLRDSFLKSKKHPYSFVQEFLEKQGAWDAIEAALGKHNTTLGILGLRDRYGVLIAPLWEELVCGMTLDQSLFMTLAIQEAQKDDAQPDGSADKSELPIQQSSASVPSHGTAGQDAEGDAELEQHSASTSSARNDRPMKPRLYPGRSTSARNSIAMTTEVNQEFDTDRTTDTTTHEDGKPVQVSKRWDWTPEEDKTMKSYFKPGKTQQQIAAEVHQEFDIDRTQSAIYKRLRKTHGQIAAGLNQGPSTSQVKVDQVRERIEELRLVKKAAPYTEAEQAMIISGAQLGKSASEIAAEANKEFHNDRSTNAISRQRKILMGPGFESGHPEWSPSELSHLWAIVSSGEHIPTAAKSWVEQTGSKRTPDAVVARLKLIAAETAVPWTDEEDAALMTACEGLDKTRPMTEAFKSATDD